NVAQALKFSLSGAALGRSIRYAPSNIEAYEYYLRGRQMGGQYTDAAWKHAPKMFRRAVELDPNYAQAWAGLADCLAQQLLWRFMPLDQVLPEASAAASKALDLAPEPVNARVHDMVAGVLQRAGRAEEGREYAEKALRMRPDDFATLYNVACYYSLAGDCERALGLLERAIRLGGGYYDWIMHDDD